MVTATDGQTTYNRDDARILLGPTAPSPSETTVETCGLTALCFGLMIAFGHQLFDSTHKIKDSFPLKLRQPAVPLS